MGDKKQIADLCRMVGCTNAGRKFCGACGVTCYCSVDCQKEDWKVHKRSCARNKKLPVAFLSMTQIEKRVHEINDQEKILRLEGKYHEIIIFLQKCLQDFEHQYGVEVEGTSDWKRSNGDLVENWLFINILLSITKLCIRIKKLHAALEHAQRARGMLEHRDRSHDCNLCALVDTEILISVIFNANEQFDSAEYHCEQCLIFTKLIKKEGRLEKESEALLLLASIRERQSRYSEAVDLSEKAYIILSEAYGPVHPDVQGAASHLIECLISNGDYSRADDYQRMNYENLTDPRSGVGLESEDVANAMIQIARIWLLKAPVDDEETALASAQEAENLMRKVCGCALDVKTLVSGRRYETLADVLLKRGKYTDETRIFLEQLLSLYRDVNAGVFERGVPEVLNRLVQFHDHISGTMPPGDASYSCGMSTRGR